MSPPPASTNYGNKRRHIDAKNKKQNPSRGASGVLLTCETGKERRCRLEALDILQYYLTRNTTQQEHDKLSLDQELALLKEKTNMSDIPFQMFDTGCKGTVFLVCTLPGAQLIEPLKQSLIVKEDSCFANDDDSLEVSTTKKQRPNDKSAADETFTSSTALPSSVAVVDSSTTNNPSSNNMPWDPLETVANIIRDMQQEASDGKASSIPSSRFISRIIPMQATCFANAQEIQHVVKALLQRLSSQLTTRPATFAVQAKSRHCTHLSRMEIVGAVATQVDECTTHWTVQLTQPDYAVVVEVCKTLCGVSILPRAYQVQVGNGNVAELMMKPRVCDEQSVESVPGGDK
jgi:tRNA(Ser,Leu) C12 N-acetylase TAN1